MDTFYPVLTFLMILIAAYFSYQIVNVLFTIFKEKRKDPSMEFCLTAPGKIFYVILSILYVVILIGSIAIAITYAIKDKPVVYMNAMVVLALYSILYSFQIANICLTGKKSLLVGRLLIDYRKMKKVDLTIHNEMKFVYSQKSFRFSTRWIDIPVLRRAISRRS